MHAENPTQFYEEVFGFLTNLTHFAANRAISSVK